nr:(3S,6E)-nerolidol synthase 1-like [Ipomoea batatas]
MVHLVGGNGYQSNYVKAKDRDYQANLSCLFRGMTFSMFMVIHDTTHEISNAVYQEFGWNPIDHLKKAWASLCDAFLTEAKWFAFGNSPRAEEYLKNGIISSGIPMVLTNLFFLLGYGESTGTTDIEGIISSVAAILRLLDDLGTAEDEGQEGNDGSYMEYYMKEQQGWSLSDGRQHVLDKNLYSESRTGISSPSPHMSSTSFAALEFQMLIGSPEGKHKLAWGYAPDRNA